MPTATLGSERSDPSWRCYQHCPRQKAVRVKAGCWVEEACPATSHKAVPASQRVSAYALELAWLSSQAWIKVSLCQPLLYPLLECRNKGPPLSRLSLGNSHQQVPQSPLGWVRGLSAELGERWLDPEQHFDPRTKAPSHLLGSGLEWGERFTFFSPWVWVPGLGLLLHP